MLTENQSPTESVELKRRAAILKQYEAEGRRIDGVKKEYADGSRPKTYAQIKAERDAYEATADKLNEVVKEQDEIMLRLTRQVDVLRSLLNVFGGDELRAALERMRQ